MKAQQQKMFKICGLTVTGTKEQIKKYASDTKEFDYIKNSLEIIIKSTEKQHNNNTISISRVKQGIFLAIIKENQTDDATLLIRNTKERKWQTSISIDELEPLKSEENVKEIMHQINQNRDNIASKETLTEALQLHKQQKINSMQKHQPKPLSDIVIEDTTHDNKYELE